MIELHGVGMLPHPGEHALATEQQEERAPMSNLTQSFRPLMRDERRLCLLGQLHVCKDFPTHVNRDVLKHRRNKKCNMKQILVGTLVTGIVFNVSIIKISRRRHWLTNYLIA